MNKKLKLFVFSAVILLGFFLMNGSRVSAAPVPLPSLYPLTSSNVSVDVYDDTTKESRTSFFTTIDKPYVFISETGVGNAPGLSVRFDWYIATSPSEMPMGVTGPNTNLVERSGSLYPDPGVAIAGSIGRMFTGEFGLAPGTHYLHIVGYYVNSSDKRIYKSFYGIMPLTSSDCSSNYGSSCSSPANSCGMTNSGTYKCSGSCTAVAPSNSLCPVTLPPCVYSTVTWGACQPNGTQTGTYTTSPASCTPGTPPATTRTCTYIPPTTPIPPVTGDFGPIDIGLRMNIGTPTAPNIIKLLAEPKGQVTSPLRIAKDGVVYGIILVTP